MFDMLDAMLGPAGIIGLMGLLTFGAVYLTMTGLVAGRIDGNPVRRAGLYSESSDLKGMNGVEKRKKIQEQLKTLEEARNKATKVSLQTLMTRAGLKMAPLQFQIMCAGFGVLITVVAVIFGMPPVFAIGLIPAMAVLLPKIICNYRIKRIHKKFIEEFPNAIDILVRGVRTGLPVNEGLRTVCREIPDPVATEFRMLTEATGVGVTLEDALDRFFDRMPLSEVNFFNIVLTIQKQTGGNLSEALGNLSMTLRDRKKLRNKIKALSSEAKASASIIGAMPFILGTILYAVSPDYIGLLFSTEMGHMMAAGGLIWMSIGIFVMKNMIAIEI